MTIPRNQCSHLVLQFNSGDYYIFCVDCGGKWCAHSLNGREYGQDAKGDHIGADSSVCIAPGMNLSGARRYALKQNP